MSSPRRDSSSVVEPGGHSLQGPHRVEAFARCPQLEGFAQELHLRPIIDALAPRVGTLVHAGLAYRYGAMLETKPEWLVYADGYEVIRRMSSDRVDYCDLATRVFAAYEEHYRVNVWRPLLVEHQFVVHFANGEPYSCRTDLLAEDGWGDVWVIDHKSCGRLSQNLKAKYETDWQMLTNLALSRALGYKTKGVVINEFSRQMPTPAFQRQHVPMNEKAYAALAFNTEYYLDQMKAVRERYPDPTNRPKNTGACQGKFGTCDFYGICFGNMTIHEFKRPEDYVDSRAKRGT